MEALQYPVLGYPKGDNSPDYVLGSFINPTIISVETGEAVERVEYENEQFSLFGVGKYDQPLEKTEREWSRA